LLIVSSGCIASIVRFPILHGLTETDDFLWANRNNAFWSTVEAGTGVIASSIVTLRPLFKTFFTQTQQTAHTLGPDRRSRGGYFTNKPNGDDLELRPDFSKSIHVKTTVVNSESTRVKKLQEVFKGSSESVRVLKGDSKWNANLETESVEEIGHGTIIEGGRAV
jgi:hypothetical protein